MKSITWSRAAAMSVVVGALLGIWNPSKIDAQDEAGKQAADARLVVRPYGTDGVRVSVGAPEENDALLRFARDWITHTESQE